MRFLLFFVTFFGGFVTFLRGFVTFSHRRNVIDSKKANPAGPETKEDSRLIIGSQPAADEVSSGL